MWTLSQKYRKVSNLWKGMRASRILVMGVGQDSGKMCGKKAEGCHKKDDKWRRS